MNKIPVKIKYIVFAISGLTFLLLSFGLAPILVVGMIELLSKITGYHFAISTDLLDYLVFASIPVFGMWYNSTRMDFRKSELIKDILTVLLYVLIVFGAGLFLMTFLGVGSNPLIPKYLLIEPFDLFSTLLLGAGITLPFLLLRLIEKPNSSKKMGKK